MQIPLLINKRVDTISIFFSGFQSGDNTIIPKSSQTLHALRLKQLHLFETTSFSPLFKRKFTVHHFNFALVSSILYHICFPFYFSYLARLYNQISLSFLFPFYYIQNQNNHAPLEKKKPHKSADWFHFRFLITKHKCNLNEAQKFFYISQVYLLYHNLQPFQTFQVLKKFSISPILLFISVDQFLLCKVYFMDSILSL